MEEEKEACLYVKDVHKKLLQSIFKLLQSILELFAIPVAIVMAGMFLFIIVYLVGSLGFTVMALIPNIKFDQTDSDQLFFTRFGLCPSSPGIKQGCVWIAFWVFFSLSGSLLWLGGFRYYRNLLFCIQRRTVPHHLGGKDKKL